MTTPQNASEKPNTAACPAYDEMTPPGGGVRSHYQAYAEWLKDKPMEYMLQKQREADLLYTRLGITFAVYGDESGVERSIPFDIIPRILRLGEDALAPVPRRDPRHHAA